MSRVWSLLWRRLAASAGLLVLLAALDAFLGPDHLSTVIAYALLGALLVQIAAAVYWVWKATQRPTIVGLRAKAQDHVALAFAQLAVVVVGLAVVARQAQLIPQVPRDFILVALAFACLLIAAPAINGFVIFRPWRGSDYDYPAPTGAMTGGTEDGQE